MSILIAAHHVPIRSDSHAFSHGNQAGGLYSCDFIAQYNEEGKGIEPCEAQAG